MLRRQLIKHFTCVTYNCTKIIYYVKKTLHSSMHSMERIEYLANAVGYKCRIFMKSTTGQLDIIKLSSK